jgi:hypothetical protein
VCVCVWSGGSRFELSVSVCVLFGLQITGLGYPSLACRAFVCQLHSALCHPDACTEHGAAPASSFAIDPSVSFEAHSEAGALASTPSSASTTTTTACDANSVLVAGVFDYNPHGADILMCYKFGSVRAGLESFLHTVPHMQWIGHSLLPLTLCTALSFSLSLFCGSEQNVWVANGIGVHWSDIQSVQKYGASAFGCVCPSPSPCNE